MTTDWDNLQDIERRVHQSLQDAGQLIPLTVEGVEKTEAQFDETEIVLPPPLCNPAKLLAQIKGSDQSADSSAHVFGRLISLLRKQNGYSVSQLAEKARIDEQELIRIEAGLERQPKPRTVAQLATVFGVRPKSLARVANLTRQVDDEIAEGAVRFAACAKDMDKLTREEIRALKQFIKLLNSKQ